MMSECKLNVASVSFESVILNRPFEWLIKKFSGEHVVFLKIRYKMKISLINLGDRDFHGGNLNFMGLKMVRAVIDADSIIPTIKRGERNFGIARLALEFPITKLVISIRESETGKETCFCNKDGNYINDSENKYRYEIPIYVTPMINAISMTTSMTALLISLIISFKEIFLPLFDMIFQAIVNFIPK